MKLSGTSLPRSLWFEFEVNAVQSSGQCPGASTTFREGLDGGGISDEGAREEFERTFVGGNAKHEGGRRRWSERSTIGLNVGGFNRGGPSDGADVGAG